MSSNIRITKICIFCNSEFTAKTTVTKYCSLICASRWNKQKARNAKIEISNEKVKAVKTAPTIDLKDKEFLTVKETALLLNCSKQNVNKLISKGKLKATNILERKTIVKRSDLDEFIREPEPPQQKEYDVSECCTIGEAQIRFGISQSGLRNLLIKHNVPKIQKHKFVYVPIAVIEKILS
ncbi:transposase [Flavobacterium psychrophilum]|uniref:helix-turn-helix domain-containing protein n=1 Tax=Flavobacterium psychrophilum TaxID=96345 RepID=UPI000B7C3C9B|nr:helix-turn-helix domain-containing protein [Flavobacterium psychrophilum]EKT3966690.1 helix-turn-helix domain-containing protein [Flavobacterium psychrophilum]ELV7524249.1 helix-turn-helix domain-containing protein [Flavobacterium psychrophilum]SNB42630.1 transposase [Flavobacterium psychrophilum]